MPVEMIRRHIEQCRYQRPEIPCRLQLKAAAFRYHISIVVAVERFRHDRNTDVADDFCLFSCVFKKFPHQSRRGGLPVCTGDSDVLSFSKAISQLQLTGDLSAGSFRFPYEIRIHRHPGLQHHQVKILDRIRPLTETAMPLIFCAQEAFSSL